jgi:hypothetical protein
MRSLSVAYFNSAFFRVQTLVTQARMIPYSILLTCLVLILVGAQVANAQVQVYTKSSSANVNRLLQDKQLQMLVVTVVANETQQPVDYIYLVVWEEVRYSLLSQMTTHSVYKQTKNCLHA